MSPDLKPGVTFDKITEGVHERMIIDPAKFNARMAEKKAKPAA